MDKNGAFCGDAPSTKRFELKLYNAGGVKFLISRRVIRCNGKFVIDRTYVSSCRFSCSCARHGKRMRLQMASGSFLTHRRTTLLLPLSKHEREQVRCFFSRFPFSVAPCSGGEPRRRVYLKPRRNLPRIRSPTTTSRMAHSHSPSPHESDVFVVRRRNRNRNLDRNFIQAKEHTAE